MKPGDLLERHADAWQVATRHPFLAAVRDGTLDPHVFATWLVQDYLFVRDEFASLVHLLPRAPRSAQNLLVRALVALEAELSWFEEHALERDLSLDATYQPATAAYRDFLDTIAQTSFPVAITALWAAERAYLESWTSALPGYRTYQAYVTHWANPEFESFVAELEAVTAKALARGDLDAEAEAAFLRVARLEHDFWEMAWSGGRA